MVNQLRANGSRRLRGVAPQLLAMKRDTIFRRIHDMEAKRMRLLLISAVVVTVFGFHKSAEARPPYKGVYAELSPNDPVNPKRCRRCNVCHVPGDKRKKLRNPYGKAIEKALPHPNVKDRKLVKKAIKSAEKFKPKPCRDYGAPGSQFWRRLLSQ